MSQRKFDFTGADGQKLSGLLDLPEGQAQAYALFAHCFTCNKNSLAAVRVARALTARGIGVKPGKDKTDAIATAVLAALD